MNILETSVALLDCNFESCNLYEPYISPRRDLKTTASFNIQVFARPFCKPLLSRCCMRANVRPLCSLLQIP